MESKMPLPAIKSFKRYIGFVLVFASLYLLIKIVEEIFLMFGYAEFSSNSPAPIMLHAARLATVGFYYLTRVELAIYLICAVSFLMMIYRVAAKAKTFSVPYKYSSPGMAVGYWFIPILNLIRPYQVMDELFRSISLSIGYSQDKVRGGSLLVRIWWCVLLFDGLVSEAVARFSPGHIKTLHDVANFDIQFSVPTGLSIVSAFLFLLVLNRLRELHAVALEGQQPGIGPQPAAIAVDG